MPPKKRRLLDRYPGAKKWTEDVTVIGPRLFFVGEIHAPGAVVVAGQVDGEVVSGALVRVLDGGLIRGMLRGEDALIEGTVEGPVVVQGQVEIDAKAKIKGDITGGRVFVGRGATVRGKVRSLEQPLVIFEPQRKE